MAELMSFLHTLPSYLQENPKVFGNAFNYVCQSSVRMTRRWTIGHPTCITFIFLFLPATARDSERNFMAQHVARVLETDLHCRVCVSESDHSPNVTAIDKDGQGGRLSGKLRRRRASNHDAVIR